MEESESLPVIREEVEEAESLPAIREEVEEAESLPVIREEVEEAESLPVIREEVKEAESLPVIREEVEEAGSLPVIREEVEEAESLPVIREEVEEAVRSTKAGKSPGVDNFPSESIKNGGEATRTVLTAMPEDPGDEGMVKRVETIVYHAFTKERQSQAMSELSYHQSNQPSQRDHAPSHPQPTEGQGCRPLTVDFLFSTILFTFLFLFNLLPCLLIILPTTEN